MNALLEIENLEKIKPIPWFYPLIEVPAIKFQVVFALNKRAERNATVFLPEEDKELFSFVKEGEVQLASRENKTNLVVLKAGEKGVFSVKTNILEKQSANLKNELLWRTQANSK